MLKTAFIKLTLVRHGNLGSICCLILSAEISFHFRILICGYGRKNGSYSISIFHINLGNKYFFLETNKEFLSEFEKNSSFLCIFNLIQFKLDDDITMVSGLHDYLNYPSFSVSTVIEEACP